MSTPKRVLVVDDEEHVVAAIKASLQPEGYAVIPAYSGEEALQLVEQEAPDAIVLDVMMPGMDGWQVLETLRSRPETADLPVVMLTALAHDQAVEKGWDLGAHAYLTKPFDPLKLSRILAEQMELAAKRRSQAGSGA